MAQFIEDLLTFYRAKKAWVGGIVFVVTQVVAAVQLAIADEAITFDEAEGVYLLVTEVIGTLASMFGVWAARNQNVPT